MTHGITLDNPQSITIRGNRKFFHDLMLASASLIVEEVTSRMVKLQLTGQDPKGARQSTIHLILLDNGEAALPMPAGKVEVQP